MLSRLAGAAGLALVMAAGAPVVAATPPAAASPDAAARFTRFVTDFRAEALGQGVPAALYDETFRAMTPDPSVAGMTRRQPEEVKTVGAYLAAQVTAGRVAQGRGMMTRWRADLDRIQRRFGVPPAIVVAIWGLESNFGAAGGNKDVIRSLATLAAMDYRADLMRGELVAALVLLRDGRASRAVLRGSWAGAMGQPQFMPSSYARYGVDQDGDGRVDIWGSVPDALASIANFIHLQGWQAGQPWGFEVVLPAAFDMRTSRDGFPAWAARGVRRADGAPMPETGTGILYFPAGAAGPALLVTENFPVLKTYNFSDAYVLSVGELADRIVGGAAIAAPWPTEPPLSRDERIAFQARLVAHGFAVDNREGRISLDLRDVIRRAQESLSLVPDGHPSRALLQALSAP